MIQTGRGIEKRGPKKRGSVTHVSDPHSHVLLTPFGSDEGNHQLLLIGIDLVVQALVVAVNLVMNIL